MTDVAALKRAELLEAPSSKNRIAPLTGIRGIASIWVVAYHADWATRMTFGPARPTVAVIRGLPVIDRGYLGVDLFFVLSGFVLAMSYGARLSNPTFAKIKHFALGRAWRILPLHWLIMLFFAALSIFFGNEWPTGHHGLKDWFITFFLVQNWIYLPTYWNPPAWSLSAEWLAYLTFPVMAALVWKARSGIAAVAMALAALVALTAALKVTGKDLNSSLNVGLLRCFCEFFAGMCLFRLTVVRDGIERYGDIALAAGLGLLAIALVNKSLDPVAPFGFAAMIVAAWANQKYTCKLFGNRFVDWLGEISFSIYIVHWLLLEIAVWVGTHQAQSDAGWRYFSIYVALAAAVPIAALLNVTVEKPSHRIGQRIMRREKSG